MLKTCQIDFIANQTLPFNFHFIVLKCNFIQEQEPIKDDSGFTTKCLANYLHFETSSFGSKTSFIFYDRTELLLNGPKSIHTLDNILKGL